jgi:hypothetical protein
MAVLDTQSYRAFDLGTGKERCAHAVPDWPDKRPANHGDGGEYVVETAEGCEEYEPVPGGNVVRHNTD